MATARVWRSRLGRLAGIWIVVALAEWAAWRFFLRSAFYRDFFLPLTVAVVIAGLAASWRIFGRRTAGRRAGDRRAAERRRESADRR